MAGGAARAAAGGPGGQQGAAGLEPAHDGELLARGRIADIPALRSPPLSHVMCSTAGGCLRHQQRNAAIAASKQASWTACAGDCVQRHRLPEERCGRCDKQRPSLVVHLHKYTAPGGIHGVALVLSACGWRRGGVPVRGRNLLRADLQMWLRVHPHEYRHSQRWWDRPMVHAGFHRSWTISGFSEKVIPSCRLCICVHTCVTVCRREGWRLCSRRVQPL